MNQETIDVTRAAIVHWYWLADEERAMRAHEAALGHATPGYDARIRTYEETARALRLELETGRPHCSCCLRDDRWHGVIR